MKKAVVAVAGLLVCALAAWFARRPVPHAPPPEASTSEVRNAHAVASRGGRQQPSRQSVQEAARAPSAADRGDARAESPGENVVEADNPEPEDPGEKAVKAFEALTDSLMEPVKGDISLAAVDDFVKKFKALPEERRNEELHHALNLLPDGNSLYLLGVLMDEEVDGELKELVFNDFLNRSDEVKQPMLRAVHRQRSHPCWADANWVLDATGALPSGKAR